MNNEKLTKIIPIKYVGMTWIPLIVIALLPAGLIYTLIKAILLFWVIIEVFSSWKDYWIVKGYQTLGAFVTQSTVLFAIILFINLPSWVDSLLTLWIVVGFFTKFGQVKEANEIIEKLPGFSQKDVLLLQKYLGPSSYLLDKRKLNLITDEINLKQWAVNMDFIFSGISPDMSPVFANLLGEEKEKLLKTVTPELRTALMGSMNLPLALSKDKEVHAWFIAAYPDVLSYFYPSPDYGKKPFEDERKRVEKQEKIVGPILDAIEKLEMEIYKNDFEKGRFDYNILLIDLKDNYKNITKRELMLKAKK